MSAGNAHACVYAPSGGQADAGPEVVITINPFAATKSSESGLKALGYRPVAIPGGRALQARMEV